MSSSRRQRLKGSRWPPSNMHARISLPNFFVRVSLVKVRLKVTIVGSSSSRDNVRKAGCPCCLLSQSKIDANLCNDGRNCGTSSKSHKQKANTGNKTKRKSLMWPIHLSAASIATYLTDASIAACIGGQPYSAQPKVSVIGPSSRVIHASETLP